jgi:hypothetical protein
MLKIILLMFSEDGHYTKKSIPEEHLHLSLIPNLSAQRVSLLWSFFPKTLKFSLNPNI